MSREAHVRICERLGTFVPGRLDYWSAPKHKKAFPRPYNRLAAVMSSTLTQSTSGLGLYGKGATRPQ